MNTPTSSSHSTAGCRRVSPARRLRAAMTLVEMLVAMALTLLMMAAVAQIFAMLGQGVNGSRSMAELNDRMRATAYRLRQDLAGVTVDTTPPVKPELNSGYLEVIEGPCSDSTYFDAAFPGGFQKWNGTTDANGVWKGNPEPYLSSIGSDDRVVGDVDDIILFTTKSPGELFSGKADSRNGGLEGGGFRSPYAEVVWFCRPAINTFNPRTYTLHRRQRLIAAHPGAEPFVNTSKSGAAANMAGGPPNTLPFTDWQTLHAMTDISCRRQGNLAIPNSLGDLTRRENRFLHLYDPTLPNSGFPHAFQRDSPDLTYDATSPRFGEDILLTNVIAFDIRVWDPQATIQTILTGTAAGDTKVAVAPGDPGYVSGGGGVDQGAYVDLGNGLDAGSVLAGPCDALSQLRVVPSSGQPPGPRTFCTWSTHYSQMGITQAPPYSTRLEGVEVCIRCYEPSSRQVRQVTIRHAFRQ